MLDLIGRAEATRELSKLAAVWMPEKIPERRPSVEVMVARDEGFHLALAAVAGNTVLADYLKDVNDHIHIVRRLDDTDAGRIDVHCRVDRDDPVDEAGEHPVDVALRDQPAARETAARRPAVWSK